MKNNLKIYIPASKIKKKISLLAKKISNDYRGRKITAICVMKGAVVFYVHLMKDVKVPYEIGFIRVSSYGSNTVSSGKPKLASKFDVGIKDKDVLIVEDIIDTGRSLKFLVSEIKKRGARSVKIAVLCDKPSRRVVKVRADYTGFKVPDKFLVGFGLDYDEEFRELPFIGEIK